MLEAMPSQFPNCPLYLSVPKPIIRSSRDDKLNCKEQQNIAEAIYSIKKKFVTQKKLDF